MIQKVVDIIEEVHAKTGLAYPAICRYMELSYKSFTRWRLRLVSGKPLYRNPGPKKVAVPDMGKLRTKIEKLPHGRKRTQNTGQVYAGYKSVLSRRAFMEIVHDVRMAHNQEKRAEQTIIEWHTPGVVWSMDDTIYKDAQGSKVDIHQLRDLGSRYLFPPIMPSSCPGEEIAGNLQEQFIRNSTPLFLKRDNHAVLNNAMVDEVLTEHMVIPVNSPTYYPPYNGSVEKSQDELKSRIRSAVPCNINEHFESYVQNAANDLNHMPRRSLKWKNACQTLYNKRVRFGKRERRFIYDWIICFTNDILSMIESVTDKMKSMAFRKAVEAWLEIYGHITVRRNRKCHPIFT